MCWVGKENERLGRRVDVEAVVVLYWCASMLVRTILYCAKVNKRDATSRSRGAQRGIRTYLVSRLTTLGTPGT
jgi:hypothetical protein